MGDHWWLIGVAILVVSIACSYLHARNPEPNDGCPECTHEAGLDGKRCDHVEHFNGWSSERCRCDNDWHGNYESTAA
jgi:hypothetical protein